MPEAPWQDDRCIVCAKRRSMTVEHVIPQALGGALCCRFLCKPCNDRLGQIEAALKRDPGVRLSAEAIKHRTPAVWARVSEDQPFVGIGPQGNIPGTFKRGQFKVRAQKSVDGSLIQPTDAARRNLSRMLEHKRLSAAEVAEALARFDEAPEGSRVAIIAGIEIAKWPIEKISPVLAGPRVNPIVPVKIAYEYLALHVGDAILGPALDPIRALLAERQGAGTEFYSLEELRAGHPRPFHGLVIEPDQSHVIVQVRLFGNVAFRVHFINVRLRGATRCAYTHDLVSGEEDLNLA